MHSTQGRDGIGWLTPARAIWGAAAALACVPVTVKFTAADVDPFLYNAVAKAAQLPVIAIMLAVTASACFADSSLSPRAALTNLGNYTLQWGGHTTPAWRSVWRMPLAWLAVCLFDFGLFAWSTNLVDTAVATALMQAWPAAFMVLLVLGQSHRGRAVSRGGWIAVIAGVAGVLMVFAGQSGGWDRLLAGPQWRTHAAGAALALGAGVLSGAAPWTTIMFGELLWERHRTRLVGYGATAAQRLWFSLLGLGAGLAASMVLNLAVGWWRSPGALTWAATAGAAVLGGVLLAPSSVLVRKTNFETANAEANVALFASPALALALLAPFGIEVKNLSLFAAGAALILAAQIATTVRSGTEPPLMPQPQPSR